MPTGQLSDVLRQLRRAALLRDGTGLTDGQLLECFLTSRDEAAFEALLRRHGPMVLGVCRRVLRHAQDAEDAFQAAFLVLVRKAASLGRPELLGNWLYGVAYRTALDARAAAGRRRARERQVTAMPESQARDSADACRDLRPLLDQELNRLPDKYRVPVVLCDLEGRTRREVARQLGIPVGTLSGRLTTAHRVLARRLARHGLSASVGALPAALAPGTASAGVPAPLVASTVKVATAVAAGHVTGAVSAGVAALTEGVMKAMLGTKLKIATALMVLAGLVALAALLGDSPTAAQPPARPARARTEAAPNRDAAARVLKLDGYGRRLAWSPDGKTLAVVEKYDRGSAVKLWDVRQAKVRRTLAESSLGGLAFQDVTFSPDGKMIAATACEEVRQGDTMLIRCVLKVWDARSLTLKHTLGGDDPYLVCVAISPDAKLLAAGDPSKKAVLLWNAATGALVRPLKTGEVETWSLAFSPDGKTLVVGGQKQDKSGVVMLWSTDGTLRHTLTREGYVQRVALSPNGKFVAAGGAGEEVDLWDAESGKHVASLQGPERMTRGVAFSPDSKTVAAAADDGKVYLWDAQTGQRKETLAGHEAEVFAVAFSPDGATLASVSQDQTVRLWRLGKRGAKNQ
jgi:RNA polymerase sigma factor (sigma-70 family)